MCIFVKTIKYLIMKATYFKTKNTSSIIIPEFLDIIGDILSKYTNEDGELFFDCYVMGTEIDNVSEEWFSFMDDETTNRLIDFYKEYNLLIEVKDITLDIKCGVCEIEEFKKQFNPLDICTMNCDIVELFLEKHMTSDDVLEKISRCGVESLNLNDKNLLESKKPNKYRLLG